MSAKGTEPAMLCVLLESTDLRRMETESRKSGRKGKKQVSVEPSIAVQAVCPLYNLLKFQGFDCSIYYIQSLLQNSLKHHGRKLTLYYQSFRTRVRYSGAHKRLIPGGGAYSIETLSPLRLERTDSRTLSFVLALLHPGFCMALICECLRCQRDYSRH